MAAQADNAPCLIYGASGTGKSAMARWIHNNGPRASLPLVVANHDHSLVEQIFDTQGGTLVITDIGEWPLGEQRALLQYLSNRSIPHPQGGNAQLLANARIIATAERPLENRVQGGLFNGDLLNKLNVYRLDMPDLSRRQDDFNDIVRGILKEITHELHKEHIQDLSMEAWEKFKAYHWPGNMRELRNVLKIAVTRAKEDVLLVEDLPTFGTERLDLRATREEFEKTYLLELLKSYNWQIDKTCQVSRLDKAVVLNKLKKYGIQPLSPGERRDS